MCTSIHVITQIEGKLQVENFKAAFVERQVWRIKQATRAVHAVSSPTARCTQPTVERALESRKHKTHRLQCFEGQDTEEWVLLRALQ